MFEQDRRSYFWLLCMIAAMVVMAGGGVPMPTTIGTQPPFQTYQAGSDETSGAPAAAVESCLDDDPNPPLSCL